MLTVKLAKRAVCYLQIPYREKSMKTVSLSNAIFHKLTIESADTVQQERNGLPPDLLTQLCELLLSSFF